MPYTGDNEKHIHIGKTNEDGHSDILNLWRKNYVDVVSGLIQWHKGNLPFDPADPNLSITVLGVAKDNIDQVFSGAEIVLPNNGEVIDGAVSPDAVAAGFVNNNINDTDRIRDIDPNYTPQPDQATGYSTAPIISDKPLIEGEEIIEACAVHLHLMTAVRMGKIQMGNAITRIRKHIRSTGHVDNRFNPPNHNIDTISPMEINGVQVELTYIPEDLKEYPQLYEVNVTSVETGLTHFIEEYAVLPLESENGVNSRVIARREARDTDPEGRDPENLGYPYASNRYLINEPHMALVFEELNTWWETSKDQELLVEATICHTSCHVSCHGSRERR